MTSWNPQIRSRIVSLNSSAKQDRSLAIPKNKVRASRLSGRNNSVSLFKLSSPSAVRKPPHLLERYLSSSLTPDETLALVKGEIENSSLASGDDPELHAATLLLSRGWFMKLMEASKQFVTKDPKKAHFPLSIFLSDYVNMLSAKYPFWNRTHGSDHFLVACHDWGPYTLKEHDELIRNTIKVLCNADASEGIFKPGKDVSLPETAIENPRRPLRKVGGRRVSQRPILAFFAGYDHGRVRPILLKHWIGKDDDMRIYGPLPKKVAKVMSYPHHMKSTKYCICPMGYEVNSPRIVEAIYYECVPVIIADNLVPPLNEDLNWDAFSVAVAEKDLPELKKILLAIPLKKYLTMQTNVKMLQKHFLWNKTPIRYDLFHMILHSIWSRRLKQIQLPQPSYDLYSS
ncbi:hypothetical protein OROHE_024348 [Orobanche hederae]